jgi:Uma2 family endonuclease
MSAVLQKPMTLEDFLAWEECQELRWEFDGVGPVAMNGGTVSHEIIGDNIRFGLRSRLSGSQCRVFGPTLKIEVAGRIRYPDAFVACTPVLAKQTVIKDPVVVFEVLSDSTSLTDRITKLREYAATPSIQRYVILEQDAIAAMVLVRKGAEFIAETLTAEDTLIMPEIDVAIPMAEFYVGVEVVPLEQEDEPRR